MAAYKLVNSAFIEGEYYPVDAVIDIDPALAPKSAIALDEVDLDLLDEDELPVVAPKKK